MPAILFATALFMATPWPSSPRDAPAVQTVQAPQDQADLVGALNAALDGARRQMDTDLQSAVATLVQTAA